MLSSLFGLTAPLPQISLFPTPHASHSYITRRSLTPATKEENLSMQLLNGTFNLASGNLASTTSHTFATGKSMCFECFANPSILNASMANTSLSQCLQLPLCFKLFKTLLTLYVLHFRLTDKYIASRTDRAITLEKDSHKSFRTAGGIDSRIEQTQNSMFSR